MNLTVAGMAVGAPNRPNSAWRNSWYPLVRLCLVSRPLVWPPTLAVYWGGLLMSGSPWTSSVAVGLAFFTLPAGIIVYGMNDIADRASDTINGRKGSAQGVVVQEHETRALTIAIVCCSASFPLYYLLARQYVVALALLCIVLGSYIYSVRPIRLKARPVLDSVTVGAFWVVPIFLSGYYVNQQGLEVTAPPYDVLLVLLCCGFAVHAITAAMDYEVDRVVGDITIAVFLGPRRTLALCAALFSVDFFVVSSRPVAVYFASCSLVTVVSLIRPSRHAIYRLACATVAPVPCLAAYITVFGF